MSRLRQTVESTIDLHFPKAGVERADAFGRQPARQVLGEYARSTAYAENVRGYDPAVGRHRGGSRPGLSKWIAARVGTTSFVVQHLGLIVTTSQSGATVQLSQSGRVVTVFAVSQGVAKVANPDSTSWTAVTNNTGNTPALNFSGLMDSAPNNQLLYVVDGTHYVYYSPLTNALETWSATVGTMPVDSGGNKARLICTWRGRTMLSGLLLDPQNWFASAVADPTDWNYNPPHPVPGTEAVAGNNSDLGYIGDVVTGLVPWSDDVLIHLCDHSIFKMTGDPAAGGQIDRVSDSIGGLWGRAWCKDPGGTVYFMSNHCSVFAMDPPAFFPRRVSKPIDPLLKALSTGSYTVTMHWNDAEQGLNIFVTKTADVADTTHYFMDARTGAWWPDSFANTDHNPLCGVTLDGNDPNDRRVLVGSWDGYVRMLDPTASTDDGTNIASEVWIGPILSAEYDTVVLKEIQAVMGESSGDVTYEVYVGDTAEAALAATAAVTGTWTAGRNNTSPVRRADHAIYVKITATTRWAMELIRAKFGPLGKARRRGA